MMGLNPKQERFVAEYLVDLNATQAAIRAGYSPRSAHVHAARLLNNDNIRAAVAEKGKKVAENVDITVEFVLSGIKRVIQMAEDRGELNPALKGYELLGKHLQMFIERNETNLTGELTIRVAREKTAIPTE